MPGNDDFLLLAALAGYSGAGGMVNIALSSWARDKGYGMGQRAGYIPAAVGGHKVNLAHTGFIFTPTAENMRRWQRLVAHRERRSVGRVLRRRHAGDGACPRFSTSRFCRAAATFRGSAWPRRSRRPSAPDRAPPREPSWRCSRRGFSSRRSSTSSKAWCVRITDIVWTGSHRARALSRGDVRVVYYGALGLVCLWGMIALRLAQPIMLLLLAGNIAGMVFTIASLHLLYLNTRLLPLELRPPTWRRVALVLMSVFYGFFTILSIRALM